MSQSQAEMLFNIQQYLGWSADKSLRDNRTTEILSGQALAYIEALRLWKHERNELFLPRFIAPTDDLNDETKELKNET